METALGLLLMVPGLALDGWVFSVLWRWFVIPVVPVAPVSVAQGAGLALFVAFLTVATRKTDDIPSGAESAVQGIVIALSALGVGWIIFQFAR